MRPVDAEREHFEAMYRACSPRVSSYVRRHADQGQVEEIVADTFLTAWRRREQVDHQDPLPWLLVTARRIAANAYRRRMNATSVRDRLELLAVAEPAVDDAPVDRAAALAALGSLSNGEREAVLLVAWDGLDHASAARVAGCSTRAFTVRLHRARRRLAAHLDADPGAVPPGHRTQPTRLLVEETP